MSAKSELREAEKLLKLAIQRTQAARADERVARAEVRRKKNATRA